ncbi:MAG: HAMP domain-containing histidine kinase [Rikenellaceae bacterium]|jgi:signal transduction histidine kinase|nr:HAMP domain-containing histidine kinase [Rikenellaceae bacterium]
MKLVYKIISRLAVALVAVMAVWAAVFYIIVVDEINDETDDALDAYSHDIIRRALAGEELPSQDNGTNDTYYLQEVDEAYARANPSVRYLDEEVYLPNSGDTESARVKRTIFSNSADRLYELTVAIPSLEKEDLQTKILVWIVILYAILLLAVLSVNAFVMNRSFRPLYALLRWLEGFRLGDGTPELDNPTDVTEFRSLNSAVLGSARRANEMYEEQSAFIGNASHELQTPIAVCQNRLEMLADDPSLGEEQLGQVMAVRHTLGNMSRLNRNLLLLSRIDNGQVGTPEDVDLGALAERLLGDYAEIYGSKAISSELRRTGGFVLRMNETLASVLVGNLIKNAFVHTPQGGRIEVVVSHDSLEVRNTAVGGPLDGSAIFRRFYKEGGAEGSTGLGLALARSISLAYGLDLSYSFTAGMHRFSLKIDR